jgi:hypothetical protein
MTQEKSRVVEVCRLCNGSGLDPREPKNHDIPAKRWKEYIICPLCKGEGK